VPIRLKHKDPAVKWSCVEGEEKKKRKVPESASTAAITAPVIALGARIKDSSLTLQTNIGRKTNEYE
jgi:hypothetical protein